MFSSLRFRLLLPLLLASAIAAAMVAGLSFTAGQRWAMNDLQDRYAAVQQTVRQASFPLTTSVVTSLANLSGTELVVLDDANHVASTTLPGHFDASGLVASVRASGPTSATDSMSQIRVADRVFVALAFERVRGESGPLADRFVVVLFDKSRIDAASRRAALLPLFTGLSTVVLLSTVTILLADRIASRLSKLQHSVELVANGDFESIVADDSNDELGRLGGAIDRMSAQLKKLWFEVNRQQSEKLLHQVSAGMAHQLRNTLTGARLALELDQRTRSGTTSDEVAVALRELETAEDYVRRLLLVGAGEQHQRDQQALIINCLEDVRSSQAVIATHLHVDMTWDWDSSLDGATVADGSTFCAAISNLVLNSLQAAKHVQIAACVGERTMCRVMVTDDGPGIDPAIADRVFDPFVTSKPEGMGLGLPLVRRAAEKLGGKVEWIRDQGLTRFEFSCRASVPPSDPAKA